MMTQELFEVIVDLLDRHTCVIVPGWGGFVVNDREAQFVSASDNFLPPSKEVVFNPLLVHNDGLLVQEWMKRKNEDFESATQSVAKIVELLTEQLRKDRSLQIPQLGQFAWQQDRVTFVSQRMCLPNRDAYGLREFYYPMLKEEPREERSNHHSMRKFFVGTAAAVATLLLLQPAMNETSKDEASFTPHTMLMANMRTEMEEKEQTINVLESELDAYKKAPVGFYLIASDFETQEGAMAFVKANRLQRIETLSVLSIDQRYYVSVASALSKSELMEQKVLLEERLDQFDEMYVLSVAKMNE